MINDNRYTENIFSYGTLRYESVQLTTFGRKLEGKPDVLQGYKLSMLQITDPHVLATSGEAEHPILTATGNNSDEINGMVFSITPEELEQADKYEVADYKRIQVTLGSGLKAWVYVKK